MDGEKCGEGSPAGENSLCKGPVVMESIECLCCTRIQEVEWLDSKCRGWDRWENLLWVTQPLRGPLVCREVAGEVSSSGDSESPVNGPCSFLLNSRLIACSLLISCCLLPLSQFIAVQIPRKESDWSRSAFGGCGWSNFPS